MSRPTTPKIEKLKREIDRRNTAILAAAHRGQHDLAELLRADQRAAWTEMGLLRAAQMVEV